MASTLEIKYGTTNQAITCGFTGLANTSLRQSTSIDNTTNLFLDALVGITVKTASSGVSATGTVNVYVYGTSNGTSFTDGVSGSDGTFTPTSPTNLKLVGVVNTVANATTYVGGPFSVAVAFGGILPASWGIVVENKTGAALDASVGSAWYQGVSGQSV